MERGDVRLSTGTAAPVRDGDPSVAVPERASRRSGRWTRLLPVLGMLPFFLYVAVFLVLPIVVLSVEAFRATDPDTFEETWSTGSIAAITEGAYRRAYLGSLRLSVICAVLGLLLTTHALDELPSTTSAAVPPVALTVRMGKRCETGGDTGGGPRLSGCPSTVMIPSCRSDR